MRSKQTAVWSDREPCKGPAALSRDIEAGTQLVCEKPHRLPGVEQNERVERVVGMESRA